MRLGARLPSIAATTVLLMGVVWPPWALAAQPEVVPEVVPSARAEKPKPWVAGTTAQQRAAAQAGFAAGNTFFADSKFARALERYRAAVKLWDHPSIRFNMVVCLVELESFVAAWHSLERAVRFGRGPLSAANFTMTRRYALVLRNALSFVTLDSTPGGAVLELDGEPAKAGELLILPLGRHVVVARKPGYVITTHTFEGRSGAARQVDVVLLRQMRARKTNPFGRGIPWAVMGGGVLLGALGAPLWLAAKDSLAEYDLQIGAGCPGPKGCAPGGVPNGVKAIEGRGKRELTGALALFVAGGAALTAGAILLIYNQPRFIEEPVGGPATTITLMPSFGGGTLHVGF